MNLPYRPGTGPNIELEIIYSLIIISICMIIYFKTNEVYKLSSHKGIKYFRDTFLFFAIAYFFRFSTRFIISALDISRTELFSVPTPLIFLLIFIYASSMGILCLIYSLIWKKFENNRHNYVIVLHIFAIFIAVATILFKTPAIFIASQALLLIYAAAANSKKVGSTKLYTIYSLVFIFLTLNIIDIIIPDFFRTIQLFIYIISIGLFLAIMYNVFKRLSVKLK